ncbi:MAG: DNA repair protein RecN [Bacteroidia bacterium]|nr:DNA repair protein RecN [Bacteroidia bacterium]
MIKEFRVQNFALINYVDIAFQDSFVVITGETGAGKSILLDALSLALGGKADSSLVFDKTKKTIVELVFDISELDIQQFFDDNALDYQKETIVRREITPDGKSRAFINDTPVTLGVLKSLGEFLIDIHSQHQNLIINSVSFRYNFVDAIADTLKERNQFTQLFKQYQKEKKELNQLIENQKQISKEFEFNNFLLEELEQAQIQEGELQQIEEELNQLENAESIIQQLSYVVQSLKDGEINAIQLLVDAKNHLQSIAKYHPKYEELAQRLNAAIIEIKDISFEAEKQSAELDINPERIQELRDRIDLINKLLKKHGVKTDKELIDIKEELEKKVEQFQNSDDIISEKQKIIHQLEQELHNKAQVLSQKRKSIKDKIEKECVSLLNDLAMPNAQFVVQIENTNEINEFGMDDIKFLFSANKGITPSEVQKSASGGEIARLMLAIKSLMAKKIQLPTIIFDEIDTGVSGSVAGKMGDIMKRMGEDMQVIAITHLPQIAAKGTQHFYVSKVEENNRTVSKITELTGQQRVMEIAKMLSDENLGDAAIQNAMELLKSKN